MKKAIANLGIFLICFIISLSFVRIVSASGSIPDAKNEFYVNDFANLFNDQERKDLVSKAKDFAENQTDGIQIVITTIESTNGQEISDYANEMYDKYEIGRDDMGVLILFSVEGEVFVKTGRKMETYLTDSKVGNLIDIHAMNDFRNKNYSGGLIKLQEAIISAVDENTKVFSSDEIIEEVNVKDNTKNNYFSIVVNYILIFALIILFVKNRKSNNQLKEIKSLLGNQVQNLKHSLSLKEKEMSYSSELLKDQTEHFEQKLCEAESLTEEALGNVREANEFLKLVKLIHPNINKEVCNKKNELKKEADISKANTISKTIEKAIKLMPTRENLETLEIILENYNDLTSEQKLLVKADVNLLSEKISVATEENKKYLEELKRKNASQVANDFDKKCNKCDTYSIYDLERLLDKYSGFNELEKSLISYDIDLIKDNLKKQKAIKREKEERDRIIHNNSIVSNKSFSSSSRNPSSTTSRGYGGKTGGGGAGRKF